MCPSLSHQMKLKRTANGGSLSVLKLVDGEMEEMRRYTNGVANGGAYHRGANGDATFSYPDKKVSKGKLIYLDGAADNGYSDEESISNTGTEETDF
uniref:Bravo_FIGEY domain-containing protein n=1 Tax=Steinernema glaseri TaxID=37863 RepID=A0A1I8AHI3_9BILA